MKMIETESKPRSSKGMQGKPGARSVESAKSLKVAPYSPIREPAMPHPIAVDTAQVMTVNEEVRNPLKSLSR